MPTAYTQNYYHAVFSTKHREMILTFDIESRLYAFIGRTARDLRCDLPAINGMPGHVHLLVRYPADLAHSELIRHIKGRSSKWVNETWPQSGRFAWQEGYGGFTVSQSAVADVERCIEQQKEHHKRFDFRSEFLELLRRHGVPFEECTLFR